MTPHDQAISRSIDEMNIDISMVEAITMNRVFDYIRGITDNEKITRISEKCYLIQWSDIGDNWTPWWHDSLRQADYLKEMMQSCSDWGIYASRIDQIIEKGYMYDNQRRKVRFNEQVREYLRETQVQR